MEQSGPFESDRALLLGLVDQLLYEDQVFDQLKNEKSEQRVPQNGDGGIPQGPRLASRVGRGERIAVIYAVGNITAGEGNYEPLSSGKTLGARTMADVLETVREDDSIKGVIVRIDSPGGDALASG